MPTNAIDYLKETHTVGELITELEKYPLGLPVVTAGCDCDGEAASVRHIPARMSGEPEYIYIERAPLS